MAALQVPENGIWTVELEDYLANGNAGYGPSRPRSFYRQLLLENHARIFVSSTINIEVLRYQAGNTSLTIEAINNFDELRSQVLALESAERCRLYLIPQVFSWGQLQITQAGAFKLFKFFHVFLPFINIVREFCSKTYDGYPHGRGFYAAIYPPSPNATHHQYELCYILQYVERNGRNHGDPWSLRQSGVYQQSRGNQQASVWIILQLSRHARQCLEDYMRNTDLSNRDYDDDPMHIHLHILLATSGNWCDYVPGFEKVIRELEEKACFSNLEAKDIHDYELGFFDIQSSQLLSQKLIKISFVLKSCVAIASQLKCHYRSTQQHTAAGSSHEHAFTALDNYIADLETHRLSIDLMIRRVKNVSDLLSRILESRNNEVRREINQATERNISSLRDITFRIQKETLDASTLAHQTQRDAKTVKALTVIAIIFLPASLVAVS
ncbi:hypothetical protein BP6252_12133 [Coleophoma cylindrospora]|uniref:CorA-like transporter domain-containing protein n=1 Tax=Coleophoma cylindrospora TaxID=1849047 RepID=A0A3D8QGE6_9HELO|nr:hypothetical protein BP6252_12133 [Coleophoma cylindrospora]